MLGVEAAQDLDRQYGTQCEILLPAIAPAAAAEALQQEYVVRIEMRAYTATWRGVADHQVIEARVRQKCKPTQQGVRRIAFEIRTLNQQRPVGGRQRAKQSCGERPMFERPGAPAADHQPRFDIVSPRQGEQFGAGMQAGEIRDGAAYEQGFLLPETPQKGRRRPIAEQRQPRGGQVGHCVKPNTAAWHADGQGAYNARVCPRRVARVPPTSSP